MIMYTHDIVRHHIVLNYNSDQTRTHSYQNIFLVAGKILASYSYNPVSN